MKTAGLEDGIGDLEKIVFSWNGNVNLKSVGRYFSVIGGLLQSHKICGGGIF